MSNIIDGTRIAKEIRENIKQRVVELKASKSIVPGLAVIIAGDDEASHAYVSMKEKACKAAGFHSEVHRLPEDIAREELMALIQKLNKDEAIHGILVQVPLPKHLDENDINALISPQKDVDGFHAINTGNLLLGEEAFIPCTPKGIIKLIKSTGESIEGKNAVVVGRSNIVGKPCGVLLLNENATVTICHSKTKDMDSHIKNADILVVAVGKPNLIKGSQIKKGAIVIDAGTRKVGDKLVGDVDFESAKDIAGHITPVPGGVGPMTIAMLLENTLEAAEKIWK